MTARGAEETSHVWDEVVSATHYLRELERPGFTVWDAVDEAVRWWMVDHLSVDGDTDDMPELPWDDPDPLRTVLGDLLNIVPSAGAPGGHALAAILDAALVAWLGRTSDRINDGHAFRRTWSLTDSPREVERLTIKRATTVRSNAWKQTSEQTSAVGEHRPLTLRARRHSRPETL